MTLTSLQLWDHFRNQYAEFPSLGLSLDVSRMDIHEGAYETLRIKLKDAIGAMAQLEAGAIANPDENRMVGHYWLRNAALAPSPEMTREIEETQRNVLSFASRVHSGEIIGENGNFTDILVIGIGGSALGPQFVAHSLGSRTTDRMRIHFLDNTDPDGIDRVLADLNDRLGCTLCVVISKSGGTKETRNGMLETKAAYERNGLAFAAHAVAVTGRGSELDRLAEREGWRGRFPMWDWVGGRTSVTSAVGLLPAALQGINIKDLLNGARECDEITRLGDVKANPAALLAMMWHHAGGGKGLKDMVIIPYKDRLELFSKYLQQLVMESLGKELDLEGNQVNQGLAVYGNKGSTDQHAYVQQLRDGINNFFVTFIRVLVDRPGKSMFVEPNATSGDYLDGFLLGTRKALYENGRQSITLTVRNVSPFSVGVLIALYERAVGLYASLVGINAYHQPGVEAGKKAAAEILKVQLQVMQFLEAHRGVEHQLEQIVQATDSKEDPETVFLVLEHLTANPDRGVMKREGKSAFATRYTAAPLHGRA